MTEDKTTTTETSPLPKESKPFDIEKEVREGIKQAVNFTNRSLASLEKVSGNVNSSFVSNAQRVGDIVATGMKKSSEAYELRYQYGPQIVAGTGLFVGSLVGLRRGRIPGIIMAGATSIGSYTAIYRPETFTSSNFLSSKKD